MPNLVKVIEEPTLTRLNETVAELAKQGWQPVDQPMRTENGYTQRVHAKCCLC